MYNMVLIVIVVEAQVMHIAGWQTYYYGVLILTTWSITLNEVIIGAQHY